VSLAADVIVRRAEKRDLAAILDVYEQDELSTSPRPVDLAPIVHAFETIASDPMALLCVATERGGVVGTFQMNILRHLTHGGAPVAQIEAVAVAQAARGRGIGTAMMRFAIAEARRHGCIRAQLTSQKRRTRAHGFYEALGFKRTHEGMKLEL
jgi:GNAT superfamily N-acetyltransferase